MGEESHTRNIFLEAIIDVWLWLFADILEAASARLLYRRRPDAAVTPRACPKTTHSGQ